MMGMLTTENNGRALTIADYEARIEIYKEQIGTGYIGIGRTLNEAKDAGAVPHGEWAGWVERVTGLNLRQAQRCMQAAREIRDGSAMARLEMSKALLLLSSGLDEETREEMARAADADGATVKQLREEIAEIKRQKDVEAAEAAEAVKALKLQAMREAGTAAEIREELKRATKERNSLEEQMRATVEGYKARIDQAAGEAYQRGMTEQAKAIENGLRKGIREEYAGKVEYLKNQQAQLGREIDSLTAALKAKEAELEHRTNEAADLRAELEAAERREEKRSAQLQRMQGELETRQMDAARGVRTQGVSGPDLGEAVRRFLAAAGVLPQMGAVIARMDEQERAMLRAHVDTVAAWVNGARSALDLVAADATVA